MKIRMFCKFLGMIGLLLFTMIGHGQESGKEGVQFHVNESWEAMLAQAKKEKKNIFLDAYTVWCGPCKALDARVFPNSQLAEYFNKSFVNVKYDMEKGDGRDLAKRYDVKAYPTMMLIDAEGKLLHRIVGYTEVDNLLAAIKDAMAGNTFQAMEQQYAEGDRSPAFIGKYIHMLDNAYFRDKAQAIALDYLSRKPVKQLTDTTLWNIAGKYITDPYGRPYQYIFDHIRSFPKGLREEVTNHVSTVLEKEVEKMTLEDKAGKVALEDPKKEKQIRVLLGKNVHHRTAQLTCILNMQRFKREGKADSLFYEVQFARRTNLFNIAEKFYTYYHMEYLAKNIQDMDMLRALLKDCQQLLEEEQLYGYYEFMAICHERLGNKAEAEKNYAIFKKKEDRFAEKMNWRRGQ